MRKITPFKYSPDVHYRGVTTLPESVQAEIKYITETIHTALSYPYALPDSSGVVKDIMAQLERMYYIGQLSVPK